MRERRYVIAGIGHTAFGKLPGRDTVSLNVEACREALADAGIDKSVVDAVFVKVPTSAHQFMYGQKVAEALGIAPRIGGAWDQGGAANITLLSIRRHGHRGRAVRRGPGLLRRQPAQGNRAVYARPRGDDAAYGWLSTAAGYAMIQRRHMSSNTARGRGFRRRGAGQPPHGAGNPHAQLRKPLTMDEYLPRPGWSIRCAATTARWCPTAAPRWW
jgi:hypothetical protein